MPTKTTSHKSSPEEAAQIERDPFLNPYRTARTAPARALIGDVQGGLYLEEEMKGLRTRKRRPIDQAIFESAVAALVSDLTHWQLNSPETWVAVSLTKRHAHKSRYRSPIFGRTFSALLGRLQAMRWLDMSKGRINPFDPPNRATTLRAAPRLIARAKELGVGPQDFGVLQADETIVLKKAKEDRTKGSSDQLEYEDTESTTGYRGEMHRINSWLADADIEYLGADPDSGPVDTYDRYLRRHFNGSWGRGGRLFGGFWMNLKKTYRSNLYIDGCEVVTLDYSQMVARTVYAMAGQPFPERDAYVIDGFQHHRAAIKKVFSAMLYSDKPLVRFPEGITGAFPVGTRFEAVSTAILNAHEPIRSFFYRGMGLEAMFKESTILVDVLLRLIDQRITALPIHDAVMVSKDNLKVTMDAMKEAFKDHLGVFPVVVAEEG